MLRTENVRIHLDSLGPTWTHLDYPSVPHTWTHLDRAGVFPPFRGGNPHVVQVWSAEGRKPLVREGTR